MKRLLAAALAVLAVGVVSPGGAAAADAAGPNKMSYIVVPHPDDEAQAWSLIENSTGNYKVFIMLTRGEQTYYCNWPGYEEGTGEQAPSPWPQGKWTPSCEQARMDSFFEFMAGMALTDSALPASFAYQGVKGPFDAAGADICRLDGDGCAADLTAEVWTSAMGAVVWFNLGDGDVTAEETAWAVRTVRDNRTALGINDALPNHNLIGASYWNGGYPGCSGYAHRDHRAVHEALWHIDFHVGYQAVASCAADPDVSRTEAVSLARFDDAFETSGGERIGHHTVHYGWLYHGRPGYYRGDYDAQTALFHRHQHFWVRFR